MQIYYNCQAFSIFSFPWGKRKELYVKSQITKELFALCNFMLFIAEIFSLCHEIKFILLFTSFSLMQLITGLNCILTRISGF